MKEIWNLPLHLDKGGVVRCERNWALSPEWSRLLADMDLWLVWAGKGWMRLKGGTTLALQRGVLLWMRPGGSYVAGHDPDDPLGVTFQHFRIGDLPKGWLSRVPEVFYLRDTPFFEVVMRKVVRSVGESHRSGGPIPIWAEALFRALLAECLRDASAGSASDERHARIQAQMERVHENPQQNHSVAALAAEAGYQQDHYAKIFRHLSGMSPKEWILSARLDRARRLLQETSLNITEIAEAMGYQDVFYFSKQFKRKSGVTPTEYRRRIQGHKAS